MENDNQPSNTYNDSSSNDQASYITFNIRGRYFSILLHELNKYPDCILTKMVSKDWNKKNKTIIKIDRDPKYYDIIMYFIQNDQLPPLNSKSKPTLYKSDFANLEIEADYLNIIKLIEKIKTKKNVYGVDYDCGTAKSMTFKDHTDDMIINCLYHIHPLKCSYRDFEDAAAKNIKIYLESTLLKPNIEELLSLSCSKGDNLFEISAERLNYASLMNISYNLNCELLRFGPKETYNVIPNKLVIQKSGDISINAYQNHKQYDNNIFLGNVILILNSDFEGGDFCIQYGNELERVNDRQHYFAISNDVSFWSEPVINGTKVYLIYDIVEVGSKSYLDLPDDQFLNNCDLIPRYMPKYEFEEVEDVDYNNLKKRINLYLDDVNSYSHVSDHFYFQSDLTLSSKLMILLLDLFNEYSEILIATRHRCELINNVVDTNLLQYNDKTLFQYLDNEYFEKFHFKVEVIPIIVELNESLYDSYTCNVRSIVCNDSKDDVVEFSDSSILLTSLSYQKMIHSFDNTFCYNMFVMKVSLNPDTKKTGHDQLKKRKLNK